MLKTMANNYRDTFVTKFIRFTIPKKTKSYVVTPQNKSVFLRKKEQYDYIILRHVLETEQDIQKFFDRVHERLIENGRIIVIYNNYVQSFFKNFFRVLFNKKNTNVNWLSTDDINTFLHLSNFDPFIQQPLYLIENYIPYISEILNRACIYVFPFNHFAKSQYIIARKPPLSIQDVSTSIIIPALNEEGTIKKLFESLPVLGNNPEIIFVEGHSRDNTKKCIERYMKEYKTTLPMRFILLDQGPKKGKSEAVKKGFDHATGDILIIYDADMSVHPHDLKKFYTAIISGKGDFINGSRLVYPMETQAMQLLNILGNKLFSIVYSWILSQNVKDTLCGTKVFWRKDYIRSQYDSSFFDAHDPFGDFGLLCGARRLNLKIIDLPIRYFERTYGATNIKRFRHAWELAKYSLIAMKRLKMRLSL